MLRARDLQQFIVFVVVAIAGVEAQQPQVRGKTAKVHVEHEAWFAKWPRAQAVGLAQLEAFEHRVDGDALAAGEAVRERHRLAIDQDEINLGMRHAQGLDAVLHAGRSVERMDERPLAQLRCEEVAEFLVEAELALARGTGHV